MKTKTLIFTAALTAALAAVPTYAYAVCAPSTESLAPVRTAVSTEMTRLAPYTASADSRDLDWVKDHMVQMVPEWLPTIQRVAAQNQPELAELADTCYQGSSADMPNFIGCVKKGMLTVVLPRAIMDLPAACSEISTAMADADIGNKARSWANRWANEYIQYRETRPAQ
ncbi:hypothetical protein ALI144C_07585 [Actinosynnema sp. ALI-1.44]|uniref:hypothetical protein n=1 Tax=Actinosynnema sp. ALI-1.44 TaxID=1933779 RepID=UPI00097BD46F|nr:hypothetical protein [Actinosynnema sp. ALI-1.44]ONI88287.1 hypothetical protein ALI144C_07585 [Actinosynnema sp. ALI-1.44]